MKNTKYTFLFLPLFLCTLLVQAQEAHMGMRYQAIARDIDGALISNESMVAKVELLTVSDAEKIVYQEVHEVESNQFGLLNLTIGEGQRTIGAYSKIPWSGQNIWIRISLKRSTDNDYQIVTTNKLYSVPYANYAMEAGKLTDDEGLSRSPGAPSGGAAWNIKGNKDADTHNDPPTLGTVDSLPVVFITNGQERMRVKEDGTVDITGDLNVGEDAIIGMDLTVKQDVFLNTQGGSTTIDGPTTIGGPDMNPTTITGNLQVDKKLMTDGAVNFDSTLNVNEATTLNGETTIGGPDMNPTTITGNLQVDKKLMTDGAVNFDSTLNVNEAATLNGETTIGGPDMNQATFTGNVRVDKVLNVAGRSELDSALIVGGTTRLNDSLNVTGPTVFDIDVSGDQLDQTSYPVLIKGSKQGLAIDLVPDVPDNNCTQSHRGNNYISFWREGTQKGRIEGMGRADLDPTGLLSLVEGFISQPPTFLTGGGIGVSYDPLSQMGGSSIANALGFGAGTLPDLNNTLSFSKGSPASFLGGIFLLGNFDGGSASNLTGVGGLGLINGVLPSIGNSFNFSDPFGGDLSPIGGILGQFNANGTCGANSPANAIWGSIRQALENSPMYQENPNTTNWESQIFSNYTLDVLTQGISTLGSFVTFLGSFASILDPEDLFSEGVGLVTDVLGLVIYGSYADINLGVAYESGAGDYAEWLLRANPHEVIRPGDVVGVIGGRVSKSFTYADRFMVVSTSPLLLGNMPVNPADEYLHEKIAFMGQVPVKVTGQVSIGDYILPSGNGDGVAIAVSPKDMMARDYQRIIGVAWEANDSEELVKLVNVAVGINHNDMARTIEQMQFTLNHVQAAVKKLDPSYEVHQYNVAMEEFTAIDLDYSVSAMHPMHISKFFENFTYSDRKELFAYVKQVMVEQAGIDMSQFGMIEYVLDHPEDAERIRTEYQVVLDEMIGMRDQLLAQQSK